jgi:hypothetical protein
MPGTQAPANSTSTWWSPSAAPLFIQTVLIFALTYALAKLLRRPYAHATPSAMIGASNHFDVAIATATMLFGLPGGAAWPADVGDARMMLIRHGSTIRSAPLFDFHLVFDVLGNVFGHLIKFSSMNPFGFAVDFHVLEELVEVPVLLTQLVDCFPVE